MSFLSGIGKPQSHQHAAVSGLQLQSSTYGKVLPVLFGTTRIAPNLIWYGDFTATEQRSSAGGAGKGGGLVGGGGKGGGGGSTSSYHYSAAVAMGLCEGPVAGVGKLFIDKNVTNAAAIGLGLVSGQYGQAIWGHLASRHPSEALGYSGVAYLASSHYALGASPHLSNHNIEVAGFFSYGIAPTIPDADPAQVMHAILASPHYGVGFPESRIGNWAQYRAYCIASGLWISPSYNEQGQAEGVLGDIAKATNSAFVWTAGELRLVPYGDEAVSGNGQSYSPPTQPLYDLTEDDFLPIGGAGDAEMVTLARKRQSDCINAVAIECLDRTKNYNPSIIEAKDQALIDMFGLRNGSTLRWHMFADTAAARVSAQLQLQRAAVCNVYRFALDQRYVLLDPMDIVTLTDERLGLDRQWVRIIEIEENDDGSLQIQAEEYIQGAGHAPLFAFEAGQGYELDANAQAGDANEPVIFEPTAELADGLEVWLVISGGGNWGGCDVWLSYDDTSYKFLSRITGRARTGELSAALPAALKAPSGATRDSVNRLAVDVSESEAELLSATAQETAALATLCYVDGEYIAYQNATLTGPYNYALDTLVRGAYGSAIRQHGAGGRFARLDDKVARIPFTNESIGKTLYVKLASFNLYGGGIQALSEVRPYAYTITGSALTTPPESVGSLTASYRAGTMQISWAEVSDFRPVTYEVRKGDVWQTAQILGEVSHPPMTCRGNGTYWVTAVCRPMPGVTAYSAIPSSLSVSGAHISENVIASWDEDATGWSGTAGGSALVLGGAVRTSGAGNMLANPDYLATPDIFNYGFAGDGSYEIPASHIIDAGRVVPCGVIINWRSVAQNIYDNVIAVDDFLGFQDVLHYASAGNCNVYPEIALSQDGVSWEGWQRYVPGEYRAKAFKARMQMKTMDPLVVAYLEEFNFAVDVPDREDHFVSLAVSGAGTSISFRPDGASTPVPFNGGPDGLVLMPAVQVTVLDAQAGDIAVVSSVSLSGCTVQVLNGGVGVSRNVNVLAQGY